MDEKISMDESLNTDHDTESLLLADYNQKQKCSSRLNCYLPWIAHALSIISCLGILSHAVNVHNKSRRSCIEKFNAYSPLLDTIDHDWQDVRFEYSLWYKSPFKGPPNPKVHEAWHDIMKYGQVSITASDITRIGHNLSTTVQYPPSVSPSGNSYPATAMGTHAIHCLHYIWQDHYSAVLPSVQQLQNDIPEMYERHYEHCVDYIRQYLVCKFDTTVMPFNWVRKHQQPTPNGNTIHKCVDWRRVQESLKRRAVKVPEGFEWKQPEDAEVLDWNP